MTSASTNSRFVIGTLNRLVVLHNRSLPVYLADTTPWGRPGQGDARRVLQSMAENHRKTVDRLASVITDSNEIVDTGDFPLIYTCYNDLSLDYLVQKAIELQERDLRVIDECIAGLESAPREKALAEEIKGEALAHLDSLAELQRGPKGNGAASTLDVH